LEHLWSPWRMEYIESTKDDEACVFCSAANQVDSPDNLIIRRGQLSFVILNRYPYTSGHVMVVPYDHQPSLEQLNCQARAEIMELATQSLLVLQAVYHPQGFNIGVNIGAAAGAGILGHVHLHVVPRWSGDTNFMSSLGVTRVLPEALQDTFFRLKTGWEQWAGDQI